MKTLTIGLLVMVLLAMIILAGCQQEYSKKAGQLAWEPTQTGFWHPKTN
jgi:hypothetical protein